MWPIRGVGKERAGQGRVRSELKGDRDAQRRNSEFLTQILFDISLDRNLVLRCFRKVYAASRVSYI